MYHAKNSEQCSISTFEIKTCQVLGDDVQRPPFLGVGVPCDWTQEAINHTRLGLKFSTIEHSNHGLCQRYCTKSIKASNFSSILVSSLIKIKPTTRQPAPEHIPALHTKYIEKVYVGGLEQSGNHEPAISLPEYQKSRWVRS